MKLGRLAVLVALAAAICLPQIPALGVTLPAGTEVSTGRTAHYIFAENKQNEPALAVDPTDHDILVSGANDNIDLELCNAGADDTCPFTQGVGVSGVYFSFDGGQTWTQPTYTGYSARNCVGSVGPDAGCAPQAGGPIGTLPWYYEHKIVSDGDPALAFGPAFDENGENPSWDNGSRLYYANLTSNWSTKRNDAGFKGIEAIGVSRLDITDETTSVPAKSAWKHPVLITAGSSAAFADKEQAWADNAENSPHFGNAYVCFGDFVGGPSSGSNTVREIVGRSTDGGDSWSTQIVQKNTTSSSGKYALESGTTGCTIRTGSDGTVYVFWLGFNQRSKTPGIYLTRSFDGGATFETARRLFTVHGTGTFDPVQGRNVMDGVAGARSDLSDAPSVDIANNAPVGSGTNRIVLTWVDGGSGPNHEQLMYSTSTNSGNNFTGPTPLSLTSGDRPYYTAPAISPDGSDVYVVYNAFTQPYQQTTSTPRPLIGVLLHANWGGSFSEVARGLPGDARASSANALTDEFLGDYVYAVATNEYGAAVWNDTRDAQDCVPIDQWRQSLVDGTTVAKPEPNNDCPTGFGNSSIYGVAVPDPS